MKNRTVHCLKYESQLKGLDNPPLPGPDGEKIYNQISEKAWQEWLVFQTMLINEKQLSLVDPSIRSYLRTQMWNFFNNQEVDSVEGFEPES
tara:strand:+ start:266 stop:538 length:273 start_codon:yes stop_codon:yes gene_type:complete